MVLTYPPISFSYENTMNTTVDSTSTEFAESVRGGAQDDADIWVLAYAYAQLFSKYFLAYFLLLTIVFGLIGNPLSVVIFVRRRRYDRASAMYLGHLAIADLSNTISGANLWVVQYAEVVTNGAFGKNEVASSDVGCALQVWSYQVFSAVSAWLVIAFSVERCLVIWFPIRMTPWVASNKVRRMIVAAVFAVPMVGYLPRAVLGKRGYHAFGGEQLVVCPVQHPLLRMVYLVLPILVGTAIPCLLIIVLNTLILVGIRRSKIARTTSSKDMRCLKNLLLVSSVFFVTMIPFIISRTSILYFSLYGIDLTKSRQRFHAALDFHTISFSAVNYAINPLLYTFSLDFYRKELKRIWRISS